MSGFRTNINRYQHSPSGKVHLHIGDARHSLCGRPHRRGPFWSVVPGRGLCTDCTAIGAVVARKLARAVKA